MTSASLKPVAEATVRAPVTVQRPQANEWTPPRLPDTLSIVKVIGGVLLLMLLSFALLPLI